MGSCHGQGCEIVPLAKNHFVTGDAREATQSNIMVDGKSSSLLFPQLEECWATPRTQKEKQLVSLLELARVETYFPRTAEKQWLGRKLRARESIESH